MDQITLVGLPFEEGRRFVEHLNCVGFPVTTAAWVKETSGGGLWFLYLITPLVDENRGTRAAYGRINKAAPQMQKEFGLDPMEVKVIGPNDPVAQAMAEAGERCAGRLSVWRFHGNQLGTLEIEEAYFYPATRER